MGSTEIRTLPDLIYGWELSEKLPYVFFFGDGSIITKNIISWYFSSVNLNAVRGKCIESGYKQEIGKSRKPSRVYNADIVYFQAFQLKVP